MKEDLSLKNNHELKEAVKQQLNGEKYLLKGFISSLYYEEKTKLDFNN